MIRSFEFDEVQILVLTESNFMYTDSENNTL